MTTARRVRPDGSGEGFFVSLNDLLIGLLFLFILLLMAFALRYQTETNQLKAEVETALTGRRDQRKQLLGEIRAELAKSKIDLDVEDSGETASFREEVLFDEGSAELKPAAAIALQALAKAFAAKLPCYGTQKSSAVKCGKNASPLLEAVYIEGHTDDVRTRKGSKYDDNLALSSDRAVVAYRRLLAYQPGLETVMNASGTATMFGVSAYGEKRPLYPGSNATAEGRRKNRRIAFRLLLAPLTSEELEQRRNRASNR